MNILTEPAKPLGRDQGLDGLRALAALVVLAFHAQLPGLGGGFIGVDVFFVLSGFVITRKLRNSIEAEGRIALASFWRDRLIRLCPALLLMLVVFVAVGPWLYPSADLTREFWLSALYLSDYAKAFGDVPDYTAHSWSLAVEMQFYLAWPFVVIALHRRSRLAVAALLVLFVAASLWRMNIYVAEGFQRTYYPLDTRLSGLVLGSTLAFVSWRPSPALALAIAAFAVLILTAGVTAFTFRMEFASTWGRVAVDVTSAALVLALLVRQSPLSRLLGCTPLVILGGWSYAIYIWHYPIARLTREAFDGYTSFGITLFATLLLAGLTHELLEKRLVPRLIRARPPLQQPA